MAVNTMAASASIGIAIGSAAVMAVGAATSFSQGLQQGVQNFSVDRSPVLPGLLNVDSSRPDSLANSIVDTRRRVDNMSAGLMPEDLPRKVPALAARSPTLIECFRCTFGKGKHTYSNGCTGLPMSVHLRQPPRTAVQTGPSSSTEEPQTVTVVLPPPSLPPPQTVESAVEHPDEQLERLLAEKAARDRVSSIAQPIPNTPGGTGVTLCPPDSFGSARSQGLRSELVSLNNANNFHRWFIPLVEIIHRMLHRWLSCRINFER